MEQQIETIKPTMKIAFQVWWWILIRSLIFEIFVFLVASLFFFSLFVNMLSGILSFCYLLFLYKKVIGAKFKKFKLLIRDNDSNQIRESANWCEYFKIFWWIFWRTGFILICFIVLLSFFEGENFSFFLSYIFVPIFFFLHLFLIKKVFSVKFKSFSLILCSPDTKIAMTTYKVQDVEDLKPKDKRRVFWWLFLKTFTWFNGGFIISTILIFYLLLDFLGLVFFNFFYLAGSLFFVFLILIQLSQKHIYKSLIGTKFKDFVLLIQDNASGEVTGNGTIANTKHIRIYMMSRFWLLFFLILVVLCVIYFKTPDIFAYLVFYVAFSYFILSIIIIYILSVKDMLHKKFKNFDLVLQRLKHEGVEKEKHLRENKISSIYKATAFGFFVISVISLDLLWRFIILFASF